MWWVIWLFLAIAAEVMGGGMTLLFPGAFLLAFSMTVVYGWLTGMGIGALAMITTELLFGRDGSTLWLLPVICGLAEIWRKRGDCAMAFTQWLPGLVLSLLYGAATLIQENGSVLPFAFRAPMAGAIWTLVGTVVCGAIAMPLTIWGHDWLADKLELAQYRHARLKRDGN
tara:strand:+ start:317 stop:826 length:510 start_codon:yes stop_codon:yes gene_type:complete